jgi:hypothetical protein
MFLYRTLKAYSLENAATFDMDLERTLWISGRAELIQKTLKSGANISGMRPLANQRFKPVTYRSTHFV